MFIKIKVHKLFLKRAKSLDQLGEGCTPEKFLWEDFCKSSLCALGFNVTSCHPLSPNTSPASAINHDMTYLNGPHQSQMKYPESHPASEPPNYNINKALFFYKAQPMLT